MQGNIVEGMQTAKAFVDAFDFQQTSAMA